MNPNDGPDHERIAQRADDRPPEEQGSADPEGQAEAVLADSDEREAGRAPAEHRTSDQATAP